MDYAALIRNTLATSASPQLESLKVNVTHRAWIGDDGAGADSYADPVVRRAIVDPTKRQRMTANAGLVMTYAVIQFVDPIEDTVPNSGQLRQQPIDPRDVLLLPDGGTAPIVQVGGVMDPGTSRPFAAEVMLGTVLRGD